MRVLIIRLWALGDVVVTTPLLSRIRSEWPDARVTWLTGSTALPLVSLFPGVDEILTVDDHALLKGNAIRRAMAIAGVWRSLHARDFDRVLLLHADRRYHVLTVPLRLRGLRIDALDHRSGPSRNPMPGKFRGDETVRLFDGGAPDSTPTHFPIADLSSRFPRSTPSTRRRVAIVAGGARNMLAVDALRRWPADHYVSLAEALLADGCEIVLLGDSGDRPFAQRFSHLKVTDMVGKTTLESLLQELRDADVVVTHDSGPLHLARLVRTPVVGLFGPTDPAQVVGDADDVTVVWGGAFLRCRPCYDGKHYARCSDNICLTSVAPGVVAQLVLDRLRSGASDSAARSTDSTRTPSMQSSR